MKKQLALLFAVSFLAACSATMPVTIGGEIPANMGKKVSTSVSQLDILALSPLPMESVEQAVDQLKGQCNGGKVVNITAISQKTGIWIVWNESVRVSGYCAE